MPTNQCRYFWGAGYIDYAGTSSSEVRTDSSKRQSNFRCGISDLLMMMHSVVKDRKLCINKVASQKI